MSADSEENPYASPKASAATGLPTSVGGFFVFKASFWRLFLPLVAFSFFADLIFTLASDVANEHKVAFFCGVFLTTAAVQAVMLVCFVAYFPIYISDDALRCFDFWGRYRYLDWSSITKVRHVNFLGLRYFRLYSSQLTRPLWLPLFLSRPQPFWRFVRHRIEPSSPLAQAIEDAALP